jgi:hypothetical protein
MTVTGSINFVSSTTTSITVSWYIDTNRPSFIEAGGTGAGQTLFDFPSGASKPISGSATVSGLSPNTSYSFSWYAQDSDGFGSGSYNFSTQAGGGPPFFPPTFPPTFPSAPVWTDNTVFEFAAKNQSYSDGVSATNSPTYSVISGSLPPGISLNSSTGAITGTPTTVGTYNFTVQAANGGGSVTAALSIQVIVPFSIGVGNITNVTENSFVFGYLATNEENASPANVSFSISPAGTISPPTSFVVNAGAVDNGTRTVTGLSAATTYTLTLSMSSGGDTVTDTEFVTTATPAPSFTDSSVTFSATTTQAYSDGVSATNTTSYSVFSGSLPPGINLNTSTGALTGTPTTTGTYNFVIRATGPGGNTNTGTLTIRVYGDLTTLMTVDLFNLTNFLDDPFQAQSCDFSFYALNETDISAILTLSVSPSATMSGVSSYAVSAGGGELPPDFKTLSNMDHGRRYTITATLTLAGGLASVSDTLVVERMLPVSTTAFPGTLDCPYTPFSFAFLSYTPITYSIVSGSLPPGLSLGSAVADTVTGYYNTAYSATVSGTPTTIGTYNFTVRATNSQFYTEVSRQIVISVAEDSGLVLSMFSLSQPLEDPLTGLYSVNFILEIDASEVSTSGSGGLLEVIDYPSATFNDDSFEASLGSLEQRNITLYGLEAGSTYTVRASITINCYETVATLDVTVGVLPTGGIRVMVNGDWKLGVIRVKDGGEWKIGNLRVKADGVWKLSQ